LLNPQDIAFLQYTSGSTGNPKGVVLTHANLLANVRAMGKAVEATPNDVFVSWLPLYHDMGLIGAWLGSLYFAMTLVVMSPLSFLTRPKRWLWAIHQYRGTLSASPNFGYELCLKRLTSEDIEGLDLSSWRLAFNGAEPVSPETIKRFSEFFQGVGFKTESMMPVYGLAESSVGLAFPSLPQKPIIDRIKRDEFSQTGEAIPTQPQDTNALSFVASGQALDGHEIRIVNTDGQELAERHEGYLQFRGPSVTSGYYRNPEETKKLFIADWLNSGDLAYIANGEIFITGRNKDVIIRAGRNIYPHELEEVIGNIDGIRNGCVAAFPAKDQSSATERLVILAESRETDQAVKQELKNQISSLASDLVGLPPDEIIIAPPHTVLKTSSGKVRRSACRELYEQNLLGQAPKAFWLQISRTALKSMLPVGRRIRQRFVNHLYSAYAWSLFTPTVVLTWLSIVLLPSLKWRWTAVHGLARFMAFASGTKVVVKGLENLPPASQICVFVANHTSYLDSFAINAAIPRNFSYVSKSEFLNSYLTALPLKRLRAEFVERFDIQKGINDTKEIANVRKRKQSLFFFPEGTFTRVSGLKKFRMGAFITAANANMPVVPVAIRGTRSILRAGSWAVRHGNVTITIGKALAPEVLTQGQTNDSWSVAVKLKQAAHQHILRYCGEADLSNERSS
ncbi:MAG: AMP-binding protein, partial [Gammaproteobacteria bacterium]|nr:AMP-binding protein [Gammaproteobacteria bacterium]